MKHYYLLLALPLLLASCKHKAKLNLTTDTIDSVTYPYTIKRGNYWEMALDQKNTQLVLRAMKAFETSDTVKAKAYFGDSVEVFYDGGEFKGPTAGMLKIVFNENKALKNLSYKVDDFQSVVSKDKKEEWVTTWSTQYWENAAGKKDSIDYIDDVQVKEGKIIKWYEYSRNYHKK